MITVPLPGPPHALICWPRNKYGIAVTGRTESNARFASQAAMPASKIALVRAKNIFASSSTVWWSLADTNCANKSQCPGGSSECGPLAQYSAIIFCVSLSLALAHQFLSLLQVGR